MKSREIPAKEADHLIEGTRTEDILVGPLKKLYFHMTYAGTYVCRPSFIIRGRSMEDNLILLNLAGEGRLEYRGREYRLTPGSILLIDTRYPHTYHAVGEGWRFKYLLYNGNLSHEYQAYIHTRYGPVFPLPPKLLREIEEGLDTVFRETEGDGIPNYPLVSATIYTMLTSLLSDQSGIEGEQKSASAIQKAADFIIEHHRRDLTTREIADAVYLSRTYMSELFSKTFGMPPHEYLNMYRLSCVKEDLEHTDLTIAEIAERAGFRNATVLSRLFRKKFGLSPSEYRKNRKKEMV